MTFQKKMVFVRSMNLWSSEFFAKSELWIQIL